MRLPCFVGALIGLSLALAGCSSDRPAPPPDWDFFGVVAEVEFLEPLVKGEWVTAGGVDSVYLSGALRFRLASGEVVEVRAGTPGGNQCRDLHPLGSSRRVCVVAGAYAADGTAAWFEVLQQSAVAAARGGGRKVETTGAIAEDAAAVTVRGISFPKHSTYEVLCVPYDTVEEIVTQGLPATATIELSTPSVIYVSCLMGD